jgi:hypothetical protein
MRPATGSFQIDVMTALPRQTTFRGSPTFTDTSFIGLPSRRVLLLREHERT